MSEKHQNALKLAELIMAGGEWSKSVGTLHKAATAESPIIGQRINYVLREQGEAIRAMPNWTSEIEPLILAVMGNVPHTRAQKTDRRDRQVRLPLGLDEQLVAEAERRGMSINALLESIVTTHYTP
jgi:predicted HicB family RNase H-like nuclease